MKLQRFLAAHDGVITRAQARACGLSDDQIARKVASGEWLRRAPGVYFAIAWRWTPAAKVRVAAEWARPTGALAGPAAAWWLGLEIDSPHPVGVVVPPHSSRRAPDGVAMIRRDLRGDRIEHRGLWVVARALAVLDTAVALGGRGQEFLDRALQQGRVTLEELNTVQDRHVGRQGSGVARRMLDEAADRAASTAERRTLTLLRRGGITGWTVNLEVTLPDGRDAVVDLGFLELKLALEVDGWAFHVDPSRFVDDRARKRALVAAGWVVIEVTWDDLVHRPEKLLDELRRIIEVRRRAVRAEM
ncbi:type IV toxin-antitoxin system AbiEi family antitoxin domain-containing protein [Actinomycetospora corticicola]|uniref:Very-short-patch-repair endonuclease n=1 Tax=Actinomycetospora corticicola TaxID=663602 RepID=A0A7Y9DS86_9PSEU|nr:type IV toxin-antitoxin system AbiEi family antitoxin domain-containing protein [Actinomycetospora corticicola]NYD34232.1 very-short-patch-repair endonuclease [Actinomycetospora corticicola]